MLSITGGILYQAKVLIISNARFILSYFLHLEYLILPDLEINIHLSVFTALNLIMQRILVNNLELSSLAACNMIKFCIKLREFIELHQSALEIDLFNLFNLFNCIRIDYVQCDKDLLTIDDIALYLPISKEKLGPFFVLVLLCAVYRFVSGYKKI
ncbi:uncharacterized protein T551_02615 [Pneumocystis jirovecii RU7]|uniref:Uncharacterized protein n=1 Tax=Pneumocystis jirovecii (strain RU7) TaxID=1408657 RepID=A0A0W4ZIK7_PNEJ7|nr:uncharacterized protein T551_02615 [Pneumocystis jirovecii RU7]KTW28196.1 hypothetical protein T551_02615 [Pneumocystis jirovecii RU7]